jgi:Sec-independent protein secretion pathway component TatC
MAARVDEWVSFALIVGIIPVDLFMGYQASPGCRRHESRPMRFLSIGLSFLTALGLSLAFTTFLNITFDVIPESDGGPLSVTYRIFQLDGFLLIASSLYQRPT